MQVTAAASAGFATGGSATYTLTLDNNGPQGAAGPITVTNTLPAGLTYTSVTGTGSWVCSTLGQVATCTWAGTYNKNVPTTITIVAFITGTAPASVTNVATVSYPGLDDSNLANNTASTTSAVTVRSVATTPDGATITHLPSNGTNYTQTFVITNTGGISDSYNLVASVAPAGIVTIVSVAGTAGSTATTTPVAAGATRNVDVVYSVATGAATGASATITLTATSIVTNASSNAGDLTVTVTRAGITMAKALYRDDRTTLVTGPAGVSVGEYVQYRVTVTNGGGAAAATVSVSDPIPGQVTYDSATPDAAGWTIATAAGTLTANLAGTLPAGTSRYFWIRVRVK
jgi:conserved repeat domain